MRQVKPTQKPVPSSDIKDLFFNSGLLDIWATSLERKYIDRFGNCHLTAAGMEWIFNELVEKFNVDINQAIIAAGYITVDSFQQGAQLPNNELTQRNHILRDETTGEYYRWDGDLPKQVPAGSTPQSTGGIGKGAWVSVGDASLRGDLGSEYGVSNVTGAVYRVNSIDGMKSLPFVPKNGDICITSGYYSIFDGGGAEYAYSASSVATTDGFLVHDCIHGGKWLLIDNRSRLPFQVAGARVNGVTDDRQALISAMNAKRPMSLSRGVMVISGDAINLDDFVENQLLGMDIEGMGIDSVIEFTTGKGGFYSKNAFFRGCVLNNIHIRNGAKDKTGCGFRNPRGAEQILWDNVTFSWWKVSHDVHAWNSSLNSITSRSCEYAGCYTGTSMSNGSFYAIQCDVGHCPGFRYNIETDLVEVSNTPLSYTQFSSLAADGCKVSYRFGACRNVMITSCGAEGYTGEFVLDLSFIPPIDSRQNIIIESFDIYVEAPYLSLLYVIKEPTHSYGCYQSVTLKDARIYTDRAIPLFSSSGNGINVGNFRFNSSNIRPFTKNATSGVSIDTPLTIGASNSALSKLGYNIANYEQLRPVKAICPLNVPPQTTLVVIRLQDTAVSGLAEGITCFGKISFFPINKSANNALRDCGEIIFSIAADWADGFKSINTQKVGELDSVTIYHRLSGNVHELVFAINHNIQYITELDYWCNGKYSVDHRDYYVEVA
ncbi:tail fiber/spike domain-containing protein [Providencia stuartii]|uniref:tail fiber/spike domain-containing protein n=1 Tax=Providencia stuartii TaxID=588 RepID=UPI002887184A|nr:hypothetical protein [Providencia stuartii]MDT1066010.1 hypothetical protein [Providencia stuartii]